MICDRFCCWSGLRFPYTFITLKRIVLHDFFFQEKTNVSNIFAMMSFDICLYQVFDRSLILVDLPQSLIISLHLIDVLSQVLDKHKHTLLVSAVFCWLSVFFLHKPFLQHLLSYIGHIIPQKKIQWNICVFFTTVHIIIFDLLQTHCHIQEP